MPAMAEFDVTCNTLNCENIDITIRVNAVADNPFVICGPCGNQIQDVVAVNDNQTRLYLEWN